MEFKQFNQIIKERFDQIVSVSNLYHVGTRRGSIWKTYISCFPEDIQQTFKCECCHSFLNRYGNIVGIDPVTYETMSIWDVEVDDPIYSRVVEALKLETLTLPISRPVVISSNEPEIGKERSVDISRGGHIWYHFYYHLPSNVLSVLDGKTEDTIASEQVSLYTSLSRSCKEWTPKIIEDLLHQVEIGEVQRADANKPLLQEILGVLSEYAQVPSHVKENFVWIKSKQLPYVAGVRGDFLGTLIKDIASGISLKAAIKIYNTRFETYQRTTAAPSATTVKKAEKEFEEKGYMLSLQRRHASPKDIPMEAFYFVNSSSEVNSSPFGSISTDEFVDPTKVRGRKVGIEKFLSDILPGCTDMRMLVLPKHERNLSSILTAKYPEAPSLFQWGNHVSWYYNGDSAAPTYIKERVEREAGDSKAKLRISLAWDNRDDLDLSVYDVNGCIDYRNTKNKHGYLNIDANCNEHNMMEEPVENVRYLTSYPDGNYEVRVTNFRKRDHSPKSRSFTLEIAVEGKPSMFFIHSKGLEHKGVVKAVSFRVLKGEVTSLSLDGSMTAFSNNSNSSAQSGDLWSLSTNRFHKVNAMMLSPNYWEENSRGVKHYFFTLDGCVNKSPCRGFYKEFVRADLSKPFGSVMEELGNKTMVQYEKDQAQMSGLGFSSTCGDTVICKITKEGKPQLIELTFNYGERHHEETVDNGISGQNSESVGRVRSSPTVGSRV
jgi:hypothetical protein